MSTPVTAAYDAMTLELERLAVLAGHLEHQLAEDIEGDDHAYAMELLASVIVEKIAIARTKATDLMEQIKKERCLDVKGGAQ
jgi:hypothetical protein